MDRRKFILESGKGALFLAAAGQGLFASNAFANAATGALRLPPQWIFLGDGKVALWLWLKPTLSEIKLQSNSPEDEVVLEFLGVPLNQVLLAEPGGSVVVPVDSEALSELSQRATESVSFQVQAPDTDKATAFHMGLPHLGTGDEFSFLFGACLNQGHRARETTLHSMSQTPANFGLLLGDTVYYENNDWKSKARMDSRWESNRGLPGFQKLTQTRPLFAIWDDHDFGPNDSGKSFRDKDATTQVFLEQFPRTIGERPEHIYSSFTLHGCKFIFLDNRSYRTNPGWFNPNADHLGHQQLQWLEAQVRQGGYSKLFIIGGSQFFPENHLKECYSAHKREFEIFKNILRTHCQTPLFLLSGDIHMTEVIRLQSHFPFPAVEVTCSGLANDAAPVFKDLKARHPHEYFYSATPSYGRIRVAQNAVFFDHFKFTGELLRTLTLHS